MLPPPPKEHVENEADLTLLLIEDDDADAALLASSISRMSGRRFEIERAATLAEAHVKLGEIKASAILLDLSLPDASGLEAIESLAEAKVQLPIIVLTGIDDEELGRDLIRCGAQDYLPKSELTSSSISRSITHSIERYDLALSLVAAESRALKASSAKSDFVASVSHEIRTPMHAILGIADLLGETKLDDQQQDYVRTFQRSGRTLLSLINNVLDLSRIESGSLTLSDQEFDPLEVLGGTLDAFSSTEPQKRVKTSLRVLGTMPSICVGDVDRLSQILTNLVGNAFKFTEAGEIRAAIEVVEPGRLAISIEDTGCGVAAGEYAPLFEPFSQGGGGAHRHLGGAGLGLPICRALVEMMGGTISARAIPGGGSRFEFDFLAKWEDTSAGIDSPGPSIRQEEASQVTLPSAGPNFSQVAAGGSHPTRVLLVDDSTDNRMLAGAYLSKGDFEIQEAENGAEAIREFTESGPYSVILMDMQMPVIDGYEATREIRRLEQSQHLKRTPIIALTADAFVEQQAEADRAGCDEHLAKPISREKLLSTVARWAQPISETPSSPEVDPLIADLVPGFVARRLEDLILLDAALSDTNFDDVRRIAHKLKGSGLSFGFPRLSELGAELEEAAIAQDKKEVASGIQKIREELVPYGAEEMA